MTESNERRVSGVERISLTTLIDICGLDEAATPFQAESENISGRGMRVRTSHLPEIGESLVCRFEREGREILVEGKVAWRSEAEDSGEFGVQFTALDAESAEILHALENAHSAKQSEPQEAIVDESLEPGARVRMHIEGLAAPMKAAVVDANERKLRVGSSLEFLKIGQNLELEDQSSGERRGARVDMVNVVVNPTTAIPELVVQLRYEGAEVSPQPPIALSLEPDFEDAGFSQHQSGFADESAELESASDQEHFEDESERWEPAADVLRERLSGAASAATGAAKVAGGFMSKWALQAGSAATTAAEHAQVHLKSLKAQRDLLKKSGSGNARGSRREVALRSQSSTSAGETVPLRSQRATRRPQTTPAHLRSGIHDIGLTGKNQARKQSRVPFEEPSQTMQVFKRRASLAAGAIALIGVIVLSMNLGDDTQVTDAAALQTEEQLLNSGIDQNVEKAQVRGKLAPALREVEGQSRVAQRTEIVAEIPLFGAQKLGRPPALSRVKAAKVRAPEVRQQQQPGSEALVFASGKLVNPTVHRIRLDGAGEGLTGSADARGFSVSVPRRKAMESGRSIEGSDRRIDHVKTTNSTQGTRVRFDFTTAVPAYRVSLRNDYIEFAISAPSGSVAGL